MSDNLNYGVIGNCTTAALISSKGSIDFLSLPEFNSSTVFCKLLDEKKGGSFSIEVKENYNIHQKYLRNTNILVTTFDSEEGAFETIDFCPRYIHPGKLDSYYCPPEVIRLIKIIHGKPIVKIKFDPKLVYAKEKIKIEVNDDFTKAYTVTGNYESVYLYSNLNRYEIEIGNEIVLTYDCFFLLSYHQKIIHPFLDDLILRFEKTKVYWMEWVRRTAIFPKYNEQIVRSALVLKLMTYQKTGAVLASLTTSLPETIGDVRNWDYRYCWIRDASMTISVFADLGHHNTVKHFIKYILEIIPTKDEKMQIMYGINGERELPETLLEHLDGYMNSRPVRIGNAAYTQKQNDMYGILLDVIFKSLDFFDFRFDDLEEIWTTVRTVVRNVEKHWREPDRGIWEFREADKHFVFSKVLCWVAFDRGVKIAKRFNKLKYETAWQNTADEIKTDILTNGWNDEVGSFVQFYGSTALDSSNLLMQDYGFIEATDEKFVRTVMKTYEELQYNGLMYRYKNEDDFGSPESSFTVCSFWMVESLYKIGERKKAFVMFDKLLSLSNSLGLYSEDIDFHSGRLLGNFPQAYSHLALISAAELLGSNFDLDEEQKILNQQNSLY